MRLDRRRMRVCNFGRLHTPNIIMQSKVLDMEAQPDKGFERFTNSAITITDEIVTFDVNSLDEDEQDAIRKWAMEGFSLLW